MNERSPRMKDLKEQAFSPEDDPGREAFLHDLIENGATTPLEPIDGDSAPLPSFGTYYPDEPHEYSPPKR